MLVLYCGAKLPAGTVQPDLRLLLCQKQRESGDPGLYV